MDSWAELTKSQGSDAKSGHLDEILQMLEVSSSSWSDSDVGAAFRDSGWGEGVPTLLLDWSAPFLEQTAPDSSFPAAGPLSDGVAHSEATNSINPSVSSRVLRPLAVDETKRKDIATKAALAAISFRDAVDAGDYSDYMALPGVSDPPDIAVRIDKRVDAANPQVLSFQQSESGEGLSVRQSDSNIQASSIDLGDDVDDDDDDDDVIDPFAALATQFAADMAATEQLALRASEAAALVAEQGADVGLRAFEQLVDGVEGALYLGDVPHSQPAPLPEGSIGNSMTSSACSVASAKKARLKADKYFARHYLSTPNRMKTIERFSGPLLMRKEAARAVGSPKKSSKEISGEGAASRRRNAFDSSVTSPTTTTRLRSSANLGKPCGASHGCVGWMQGWRVAMEDAHLVVPVVEGWPVRGAAPITACLTNTALSCYAVFDGHGGDTISTWCAQHLVHCLQNAPSFERGSHGLKDALVEAIGALDLSLSDPLYSGELASLEANNRKQRGDPSTDARDERRARRVASDIQAVTAPAAAADAIAVATDTNTDMNAAGTTSPASLTPRLSHSRPMTPSPVAWRRGSTLVCALVDHASSSLVVGHVGDARAVLSTHGGKALRLTEDHRPQRPDEYARVIAAGGCVDDLTGRINSNLNMTRAIGDLRYKQQRHRSLDQQVITGTPEMMSRKLLLSDEFLVLACDGVWECMGDQECVDFLRQHMLGAGESPNESRECHAEGETGEAPQLSSTDAPTTATPAATHAGAEVKGSGAKTTEHSDAQPHSKNTSYHCLIDPAPAVAALLGHCLAKQHPSEALENAKGTDNMTCLVVVFGTPKVT